MAKRNTREDKRVPGVREQVAFAEHIYQYQKHWYTDFVAQENERKKELVRQLNEGGTPEYEKYTRCLFPFGKIPCPVLFPAWLFRTDFPGHPEMVLDPIEKVAMAFILHFTNGFNETGFIECSGDIENMCKCSVEEAHNALLRMEKRLLIKSHVLAPEDCHGHSRNLGWTPNIQYLHTILKCYDMDVLA